MSRRFNVAIVLVAAAGQRAVSGRSAATEAYLNAAKDRQLRRATQRESLRDLTSSLSVVSSNSFHTEEYWTTFYSDSDTQAYEWYNVTFDTIHDVFNSQVSLQSRLLHVGCGTSAFAEKLWLAGWRDTVHCDVDVKAVAIMRSRYSEALPELAAQFQVCDVTSLAAFGDGSFDAVLEKGTFDALLSGGMRQGSPAYAALHELVRVLDPGGVLVSVMVTTGRRLEFLQSPGGNLEAKLLKTLDGQDAANILVYGVSRSGALATQADRVADEL